MALENLKSVFSSIHYIDYDTEKGGIHGGTTAVTPSQPPHPQSHTRKMETAFGFLGVNLSQHGGRHGELSHLGDHSLFDVGVGSFGSGIQIGGGNPSISLYPSVTVASHQQSFTVNSPVGFNTQVTGEIAFTRTPRVDENTLPVDFLTKGYSYTGMDNYSLSEPNEIAGFTKNFNSYGYSVDESPWGSSKFLNDGVVIDSGLAPKTSDLAEYVVSSDYTDIQVGAVDYMHAGYSYSGRSNYVGTPSTISGFTANFDPIFPGGFSEDTPEGESKFLTITSGLNSLFAPRIRSVYSGDLTTWPFTATDTNTGLFSLGVTDSIPDKSYDTHGYDHRAAHGNPTTVYQGGIFSPNLYQGSMFDDENIPAGNLLVGNHPVVDRAVNFFGAGHSYSGHSDYGTIADFIIPEIDGFNTEFKPTFPGGWTVEAPWGSSKFLNNDGTAIPSGWAPKGWSSTAVDSTNYTNVVSNIVDYMEGGNYSYTYPGGSTLTPSTSPEISGFTKNMTYPTTQFSTVSGLHPANWNAWTNSDTVQIGTPVEVKEGRTYTNISSYKVNFFGAGHSYSGHSDYGAADDIPEIPGFTTGFDYEKGGWTAEAPWGQSKFLVMTEGDAPETTGVAITSGWAPKASDLAQYVVSSDYTDIQVGTVDYMQGGTYSYTALGGYPTMEPISPSIPGFTANFNSYGYTANSTWGQSKFLVMSEDDPPATTGVAITSGWAPKSSTHVQDASSADYTTVQVGIHQGPIQIEAGETYGWLHDTLESLAFVPNMRNSVLFGTDGKEGYNALYNSDHTAKDDVGYTYPNVSRDNLSIRYAGSGVSLKPTARGEEPYIVTDIGSDQYKWTGRSIPFERALVDFDRISKFMYSDDGKLFIGKQILLGSMVRDPVGYQLLPRPQRYGPFYDFGVSTLASTVAHAVGQAVPNALLRRDTLIPYMSDLTGLYDKYTDYLDSTQYDSVQKLKVKNETIAAKDDNETQVALLRAQGIDQNDISSTRNVNATVDYANTHGDMTQAAGLTVTGRKDVVTTYDPAPKKDIKPGIEKELYGMPFYFKDLRDDKYIVFRGWIEGLSENISPIWTPENYIGRSEPVYIYERSERDISFTLKLFAQTQVELRYIYRKLNRLTSLCYPEYKEDVNLNNKIRMKPPLTKFRLGELFGSEHSEMLGFIKSLSYTYDDNSPWETMRGRRVPKYIQASITYQVIHMEVPSLNFATKVNELDQERFYGINTPLSVGGVGVGK